ncbi:MAG TPA: hypothetical protein PK156_31320 [Polyangium sp.]|nr:hypothetical protein [Polyangium sp.]
MTRQVPPPPNVPDPATISPVDGLTSAQPPNPGLGSTVIIQPMEPRNAVADFDSEKTAVIDKSKLLPHPSEESTVTIDTRTLDLGSAPALPFRPGAGEPAIAHAPRPSSPRPADFTGTREFSILNQAMDGPSVLPFADSAARVAPAKPPSVDNRLNLPDAFRMHLRDQPVQPGQTIGEALAAGKMAAPVLPPLPEPSQPVVAPILAPPAPPAESLVLLYLHRPSMPRVARKPAWQTIVDDLESQRIDPESDDPLLSNDPMEVIEQARASVILKQSRAIDQSTAMDLLQAAADKPGRFAPPLESFAGELEVAFDEIEALRARLAMMTPMGVRDERLQSAISAAKRLLDSPDTAYAVPLVRQNDQELREAYLAGKHSPRFDELDALVFRTLLERRFYQKQTVLGGEHVYARLHDAIQVRPLVVYIPAEAAPFLPLSARFRCRMIAEIQFGQDERETSPLALRCLALGHIVPRLRRG